MDEAAQHVATIETERQGSNDRIVAGHRHAEFETSVRPMLVVVPDVFPQNPCQVTAAKDQDPVEAFHSHCPHPAFRVGIGFRRANGGLDDRIPSERNTSSKLSVNFVSRSRIRNVND